MILHSFVKNNLKNLKCDVIVLNGSYLHVRCSAHSQFDRCKILNAKDFPYKIQILNVRQCIEFKKAFKGMEEEDEFHCKNFDECEG